MFVTVSSLIMVAGLGFGIFLCASILLTAVAIGVAGILRACVGLFRESNHTNDEYETEDWFLSGDSDELQIDFKKEKKAS
ncbi:MAG: hypothetical protein A2Z20_02410 [Bdellovibrionales bacterium RBG_16_40_8]|nr:MAG: hypothetical protein A2Z20_02410 [Bdellovibrionales bacterium RBG_16_40_8]